MLKCASIVFALAAVGLAQQAQVIISRAANVRQSLRPLLQEWQQCGGIGWSESLVVTVVYAPCNYISNSWSHKLCFWVSLH